MCFLYGWLSDDTRRYSLLESDITGKYSPHSTSKGIVHAPILSHQQSNVVPVSSPSIFSSPRQCDLLPFTVRRFTGLTGFPIVAVMFKTSSSKPLSQRPSTVKSKRTQRRDRNPARA